jgi:hypothetical protein
MHAENGSGPVFSHSHHLGYGSGNPYGFGGFRFASPSRPSADWNNFWHSVHSAAAGNGFWGYPTDDPHHDQGEEDGFSRGYGDDDEAASVGDRPDDSKTSLSGVPENRDVHRGRYDHTNQKIPTFKQHASEDSRSVPEVETEMDEDRTVSAPPSPEK